VSFTNNGVINSNVGSGGTRKIGDNSTFTNNGAVNINADTTFDATVSNFGTLHDRARARMTLGQSGGRSFFQQAGALNIAPGRPADGHNGTFALAAGTVSGTVNLLAAPR
jgi:hypothetical protein